MCAHVLAGGLFGAGSLVLERCEVESVKQCVSLHQHFLG